LRARASAPSLPPSPSLHAPRAYAPLCTRHVLMPLPSQALLDGLETYEGAVVVISHDRPFCEALRATHVGYVCDGACVVEERALRDADFSEQDRGVKNRFVAPPPPPPPTPEEVRAQREAEERARRAAAPPKELSLEERIAQAEATLAALEDGEEEGEGSEGVEERRGALLAQVEAWCVEMEERERQRSEAAARLEAVFNRGLDGTPPPPPPPPPPAPLAPTAEEKAEAKAKVQELNQANAAKKKGKKKKFGKRERDEYATIEADVEALEAAAAAAEAALGEAQSAKTRRPQMELMELANQASIARRALDDKMNRFLELEELMEGMEA